MNGTNLAYDVGVFLDRPVADPFTWGRRWLMEEVLPLWTERGLDRARGGYVEQMTFEAATRGVAFKRTRVTARQIYSFCQGHALGAPGALEAARHGYEFLNRNARSEERGSWYRRLDRDGRVIEAAADLCDLSFVLLVVQSIRKIPRPPPAFESVRPATQGIFRRRRFTSAWLVRACHAGSGSARHGAPHRPHHAPAVMRRLLARAGNLRAALPEPAHAPPGGGEPQPGGQRASALPRPGGQLVELFATRLYDGRSGTIAELFDESWRPVASAHGVVVEPGHLFEWAWILANFQRLTGSSVTAYIRPLIAFAERFGVDPVTGVTLASVSTDGRPVDRGSRVWPNTERIQAALANFEVFGVDPWGVLAESCNVLQRCFFRAKVPGTWIDNVAADLSPVSDHVPASTLYHVAVAVAELMRTKDAVARLRELPAATAVPRPTLS